MPASEIRREAREALTSKWGKAFLIMLVYIGFLFVMSFIEAFTSKASVFRIVMDIVNLVISIPLSFGLIISFIKLKRDETVSCFDFFKDGFSRFGKSWGIFFQVFIRMLLPIVCITLSLMLLMSVKMIGSLPGNSATNNDMEFILLIVAMIIYIAAIVYTVSRSLLYVVVYNIGYDNPELSSKECVLKSELLMKGNRGNYLLLELSFIGWAILACITLGIGFLWLLPYMQVAFICFYERIIKAKNTVEIEE